ncbi:proteasome subunit alpha type-7-1-like [Plodia interpunctella]|uniref:proteasome subunit alpha type-7-1-like n=1 Tax=Plodia interpunctella TaxID=58824 RepID=UPI0023688458|nr:proteasome subunit alpha type-7-1-like [Plodia interpunctella]
MASYDRAITVFSPDGQLLQVQYAQEAARRGSAAVGIRGDTCIVIAVEKKTIGQLQDARSEKKIVALDNHVMMAFAGWKADARILISRSQIECQSYRLTVEDPVSIEYITKYIAEMKQQYTQSNGRRPFGISCLIGGFDYDGQPHLFQTEPSGIYFEWKASSIGRCDKSVREFLEEKYTPALVATENGAVKLAIKALLEVIQSGQKNLQVAVITNGKPMKLLDEDLVASISAEIAHEKAKAESDKKKK